MKIYINALSLITSGMSNNEEVVPFLTGVKNLQNEAFPKLTLDMLPINERRRTTLLIKLALNTAKTLLIDNNIKKATQLVFASSDSDMEITHKLCQSLAQEDKVISPTQFHNSVHNAPAGYFTIAKNIHTNATSISSGNETFGVGLLEAIVQTISEKMQTLLVAYDMKAPEPLNQKRNFKYSVGIGLKLSLKKEPDNIGNIQFEIVSFESKKKNFCQNESLEKVRYGNPIGEGLPLLEALLKKQTMDIYLPYSMNKQLLIKTNV
jgi:hypothetical protein